MRFTEVSVPGTVVCGDGEGLLFVAKVAFTGDRLIRFRAKIGDVVIGPAVAPAGRMEPHPFGRTLTGVMKLRGTTVGDVAVGTGLSTVTIEMFRRGKNPTLSKVRLMAPVLGMPEADLAVIAGADDGSAP